MAMTHMLEAQISELRSQRTIAVALVVCGIIFAGYFGDDKVPLYGGIIVATLGFIATIVLCLKISKKIAEIK